MPSSLASCETSSHASIGRVPIAYELTSLDGIYEICEHQCSERNEGERRISLLNCSGVHGEVWAMRSGIDPFLVPTRGHVQL